MGYYCQVCGWHPCRCRCICGEPLVQDGVLPGQCRRCHTRYPITPSGRPPILATWSDGTQRLYCRCGVVLYAAPGSELARQCPGCAQRFRLPGDPEPQLPHAYSNGRVHLAPLADGRVPLAAFTDINCMLCGRLIRRVLRPPGTQYRSTVAERRLRCSCCGGSPIRGDTYMRFGFVGDHVTLRPDD